MKVYTKTGDKGHTALIGGRRVKKNHIRINAYGAVDELIAYVGLVRDHIDEQELIEQLIKIQDQLMVCSTLLAKGDDAKGIKLPKLSDEDIVWVETGIDNMEEKLSPIKYFVLPGGHPAVSFCHVARTVCRRAERDVLSLSEEEKVPMEVLKYLNRLSDYFFVLSRFLTSIFNVKEIPWQPLLDK